MTNAGVTPAPQPAPAPAPVPASAPAQVSWGEDFTKAVETLSAQADSSEPAPAPAPAAPEQPAPAAKPEAKAQDGTPAAQAPQDLAEVPTPPEAPAEKQFVPKERMDQYRAKADRFEKALKDANSQLEAERARIAKLEAEDKEDYETQKKLGTVTREHLLEQKIAELEAQKEEISGELSEMSKLEKKAAEENLMSRIDQLSKHYDGKNALPKFDIAELVEFGKKMGLTSFPKDPLVLYNWKHSAAIYAATNRPKPEQAPAKGAAAPDQVSLPAKKKELEFTSGDFTKDVEDLVKEYQEKGRA